MNFSITVGSMGSSLAMILGYATHHSIGWTIVDGLLGWLYVLWTIL